MSSIKYDFILTLVIVELVFAFSIGVVCVLFSYNLFRAIKDSDSTDNFIVDDSSQTGSDDYHMHHHHMNDDDDDDEYAYHHNDDASSFSLFPQDNYGSTAYNHPRQLGNSNVSNSTSNRTAINISPPRHSILMTGNTPIQTPNKVKNPSISISNANSPNRNLLSPRSLFNNTHRPAYGGGGTIALEDGIETSFDEYIINDNLSEFDVERRLYTPRDLQSLSMNGNGNGSRLITPLGSSSTIVEGVDGNNNSGTDSDKSSTFMNTVTNDIYTVLNSFTPYLKLW